MSNSSLEFYKDTKCEVCGERKPISFSWIGEEWKFTCECTSEQEQYFIYLEDFFTNSVSTIFWLVQLRGKKWMDWGSFGLMMLRFQRAFQGKSSFTEEDVGGLRLIMDENARRLFGIGSDE